MAIPYAFRKALEGNPYPKAPEKYPKDRIKYLLQDDHMKGKYLGECLDGCRWGSTTTVMWELSIDGMISFIKNWMNQNKDNFQNLFHEKKIEELYKKFELPHIDYDVCPRDKTHKETIKDLSGKLRCAHVSKKKLKPNYIESYYGGLDEHSQIRTLVCYEDNDLKNPTPSDAFDENGNLEEYWEERSEIYKQRLKKFEEEEATIVVHDICYAILSDKDQIFSLETIIKRLNLQREFRTVYCNDWGGPCNRVDELDNFDKNIYGVDGKCPGHKEVCEEVVFPFDGWTLASYVQKWYEQLSGDQIPFFTGEERLKKVR